MAASGSDVTFQPDGHTENEALRVLTAGYQEILGPSTQANYRGTSQAEYRWHPPLLAP